MVYTVSPGEGSAAACALDKMRFRIEKEWDFHDEIPLFCLYRVMGGLGLPADILEADVAAGVDVYALQVCVISPQIHILIQGDLGAQLVQLNGDFLQNNLSGFGVHGSGGLIDEGVDFRVVQTGLVGSTDGLAVVNTGEIGQHIAGRIVADGGCVIAFGRGAQAGGQGW